MRRVNPREAARMMQRMGMKVDDVPGVTQVIIKSPTRNIIIDGPAVASIVMQGQKMFQVVGGHVSEQSPTSPSAAPHTATGSATTTPTQQPPPKLEIPDSDVQLVSTQTGRSADEARRALQESGGDLAKAILALQSEKKP